MTVPSLTPPEKALKRVLIISRVNGWGVLTVASLGTLLSLLFGDLSGAAIGAVVAFAGFMEIRGNGMLRSGDATGMRWLMNAQMLALAVILVYCTSRLGSFDAELVIRNLTPEREALLKASGIERANIVPLVKQVFTAVYAAVGLTALIYQGGLALYYRSKCAHVAAALAPTARPDSAAS